MAGYGLTKENHLATVLENNLNKAGVNISVINASVSGDTTAGGLNRIDWVLGEKELKVVIVGLGANDMLRGINPAATRNNLDQIISKILDKKLTVVLAGMLAPETHGQTYKNEFDLIYKNLANKYNLKIIPFLLEGVALNPDMNQNDGIHPNIKGTLKVSDNIEKVLLPLLE